MKFPKDRIDALRLILIESGSLSAQTQFELLDEVSKAAKVSTTKEAPKADDPMSDNSGWSKNAGEGKWE